MGESWLALLRSVSAKTKQCLTHICGFMWCVNDGGLWFNPSSTSSSLTFFAKGDNSSKRQSWCGRIVQKLGTTNNLFTRSYVSKKHTLQFTDMKLQAKSSLFNYICFCNIPYASLYILLDKIQMFPISHRNNICRDSGKDYLIKIILCKHSGSEVAINHEI